MTNPAMMIKGQCTAYGIFVDPRTDAVQLPLQRLSFASAFVGH
jgi:hypothetical protein